MLDNSYYERYGQGILAIMNPFTFFENKKIINIYRQTLDDMDQYFIFSINNTQYPSIKEKINKGIKAGLPNWRLTFYREPNHQVPLLYAIIDVSRNMLASGRYHWHRGKLSSEGEELLQVFDRAASMLIDLGKTDKADVKSARKDLLHDIEIVG